MGVRSPGGREILKIVCLFFFRVCTPVIGGHCKVHACMYFLSDNYFFGRSNIDVILHGKLIFNYA